MSRKFSVVCFPRTSAFFWSCAYLRAAQWHSRVLWTDATRDDRVLNAIYMMLPWKGRPGYVDVVRDERQVIASTNRFHEQYLRTYLGKLATSPSAAVEYGMAIGELRKTSALALREQVRDANALSRAMADEAGWAIRALSGIQFASTVVVNALSIETGLAGGLVSTLYSVGVQWARSPDQLGSSDIVMVAENTGTGMGGTLVEEAGGALGRITRQSETVTLKVYREMMEAGRPINERVLGSLRRLWHAKFAAGALTVAGRGLSVFFAAQSILADWERHERDVKASNR